MKLPRENKLDKELPELLPLGREMLQTTLSRSFLTAKMRIMTIIIIENPTDNADHASADMTDIADLLVITDCFCVAKPMIMH